MLVYDNDLARKQLSEIIKEKKAGSELAERLLKYADTHWHGDVDCAMLDVVDGYMGRDVYEFVESLPKDFGKRPETPEEEKARLQEQIEQAARVAEEKERARREAEEKERARQQEESRKAVREEILTMACNRDGATASYSRADLTFGTINDKLIARLAKENPNVIAFRLGSRRADVYKESDGWGGTVTYDFGDVATSRWYLRPEIESAINADDYDKAREVAQGCIKNLDKADRAEKRKSILRVHNWIRWVVDASKNFYKDNPEYAIHNPIYIPKEKPYEGDAHAHGFPYGDEIFVCNGTRTARRILVRHFAKMLEAKKAKAKNAVSAGIERKPESPREDSPVSESDFEKPQPEKDDNDKDFGTSLSDVFNTMELDI